MSSNNPMHAVMKLAHLSQQFPDMNTTAWLNGSGLDAQKLEFMVRQGQMQQQQQQAELSQMASGRPPFSMSQQQTMNHAMQNGQHGPPQASPPMVGGASSPSASNASRRQSQSSMHNHLAASQSSSQPTPSQQELQHAQAMLNHYTGGQSVHLPNISPKSTDEGQRFPYPSNSLKRDELLTKQQEMHLKQQQQKSGGIPSGSMGSNVFLNVSQPASPGVGQFNAQDLSMFNGNPAHAMAEQRERFIQQQNQMLNNNPQQQHHLSARQSSQPNPNLQMQSQNSRSQSVAMPSSQQMSQSQMHAAQAQVLQAQQSRFNGSANQPGLPPHNIPSNFDNRSQQSSDYGRGGPNGMNNPISMALALQQQQQQAQMHNQAQSSQASMQNSGYGGNNMQLPTTPSSQSNFLPPQPSVIHTVRQNSSSSAHSMPVNNQSVRHRGGLTPQGMPSGPGGVCAIPLPGQLGVPQMTNMPPNQSPEHYPDFISMKSELTELTRRLDAHYRDYHNTQKEMIERLCMFGHCMSVVSGRNNPAVGTATSIANRADEQLRLFQHQHHLVSSRANAVINGGGRMPQGTQQQSQAQSHHSLPLMNNLGNMNMNGAESMYSPSAVSHASTAGPNNTAMTNFQAMFNLSQAQGVSLQQQLSNSLPMNQTHLQHLQQSQQQLLSQIQSSNIPTPAPALVLSEPSDSNDGSSKAKRRVLSKKDESKSDKSTSKVKSSSSGSNKDKESAPSKSGSRSSKDREKRSESSKEHDSPKKPSGSSKFSSGSAPRTRSKKEGNRKNELPAASEMGSRQTSASSTDSKPKNESTSNSIQQTPIIAVPEGTLGLTNTIDENSLHHSIVVKDSRVQSLQSPSLDHHEYDDGLGGSSSYHHPHLSIRPYGSDFGTDYQHPASPSIGMMRPTSHLDEHGFSSELHGMSGAGSPMPISPAAAEPRVGRLDLRRHHDDDAMDSLSLHDHDDGDDADRQDGDEDDNEDDSNDIKSPQNGSTSEEERLVASGGKLSRSFSTSHSHDSDLATSHSSLSSAANGLNESRKRSSTAIHDDGMTDDWLNKRIHLSMN